ncbi:MAG: DoxX family protein [Minisyncoccota bacterium]
MIESLLQYNDLGLFILRLVIGLVFIVHAIPKFKNKPGWKIIGLLEMLGGLGLIFGVLTELAAIGLSFLMLGAIYMKIAKWKIPFTTMTNTGWEYDLVILAANIVIITQGPGSIGLMM